ncbi:MAG: GLUG motif-containing protein [Dehalococcoidia bacterium]
MSCVLALVADAAERLAQTVSHSAALPPVQGRADSGLLSGQQFIGGLVGRNEGGNIENSYAAGNVTANQAGGGLVGWNEEGTVSNCFWDAETSGQATSDGGTGKTTAEMKNIATFTDTATEGLVEPWNLVAVAPGETNPAYTWNIVDGQTYPFLIWQPAS